MYKIKFLTKQKHLTKSGSLGYNNKSWGNVRFGINKCRKRSANHESFCLNARKDGLSIS